MQETTGLDLKLERIARRVPQHALAAAASWRRETVSRIENRPLVTVNQAARYRAALATCVTDSTSEAA